MTKLQKSYLLLAIALLFSFTNLVNAAEEDDINALLSEIVSEAEGEIKTTTKTQNTTSPNNSTTTTSVIPTENTTSTSTSTSTEQNTNPEDTNIDLNAASTEQATTILDSATKAQQLPETGPAGIFILIVTLLTIGALYYNSRKKST